jgi:hypothetical protein
MNTGETNIGINPVALPGYLAPITRIGGGEVRVDRAIAAQTAAWDKESKAGSLSFGYQSLTASQPFERLLVVKNYTNQARQYKITPTFRYADDEASGAVKIFAPSMLKVPPRGTAFLPVQLYLMPDKLPVWNLNGGSLGSSGHLLQGVEFDGYIEVSDNMETIHVAWQILPHRSANSTVRSSTVSLSGGAGWLNLLNPAGKLDGRGDIFALTGTSPQIPTSQLPGDGANFAIIDLKSIGVRVLNDNGEYLLQFGISTYGTRAHPNYPAEFNVRIDTDRDGDDDYVVYNTESGGENGQGTNVVFVKDLSSGSETAYFYTDADLNSSNVILTAPMKELGMDGPATKFEFSVQAFDNYFNNSLTDSVGDMVFMGSKPRFAADRADFVVQPNKQVNVKVTSVPGGAAASPSQTGFLVLYRDARAQSEARDISVKP